MARVYTVRPRVSLLLLGVSLCIAWQVQGASGGAAAAAMPSQKAPSMTLRGGSDAAPAAQQEAETAEAQKAMQEQLDYWNSLTKEQQDELLANMSPEERANAEGTCKTVCLTQARPVPRCQHPPIKCSCKCGKCSLDQVDSTGGRGRGLRGGGGWVRGRRIALRP